MKSSVSATDSLKCGSTPLTSLASMKASMSGWSQRSVTIMAPRRTLFDASALLAASHTAMNDTGPEATPELAWANAPSGCRVEKSTPTPPPACSVTMASRRALKMPLTESSIGPITKLLSSVVWRSVPAAAKMRPPGKKRKSLKMTRKRSRQSLHWQLWGGLALARSTEVDPTIGPTAML